MDGQVVDRKDLFAAPSPEGQETPVIGIDLEEVDVARGVDEHAEEDDGFQLFAGVTVTAQQEQDSEPEFKGRALSYYLYHSTEDSRQRAQSVAVSGTQIVAQALPYLTRSSTLPDINANWKPMRRKCRPGASARRRRRESRRQAPPQPYKSRYRQSRPHQSRYQRPQKSRSKA